MQNLDNPVPHTVSYSSYGQLDDSRHLTLCVYVCEKHPLAGSFRGGEDNDTDSDEWRGGVLSFHPNIIISASAAPWDASAPK